MGDGFLPKVWVETDVASDRPFAPIRAALQNRLVEEEDVVVVVSALPRSNSLPSLRRDRAREFIARTVRSIDPCVKDARGATTFDVRKRRNGRKLSDLGRSFALSFDAATTSLDDSAASR